MKGRGRQEKERDERDLPNALNIWGWSRLKPGACNSIWVSPGSGRNQVRRLCTLSGSWTRGRAGPEVSSVVWDPCVPSSVLPRHRHCFSRGAAGPHSVSADTIPRAGATRLGPPASSPRSRSAEDACAPIGSVAEGSGQFLVPSPPLLSRRRAG